jgi:hypothetical protein
VIALKSRIEELEEELRLLNPGYGIIELEEEQGWICIETPSSQQNDDPKSEDIEPSNKCIPPPPPPPPQSTRNSRIS